MSDETEGEVAEQSDDWGAAMAEQAGAEAEAPASPEPTTITWCFRLLAGFTSFISKRCLSHSASRGPSGILAFSSMDAFVTSL